MLVELAEPRAFEQCNHPQNGTHGKLCLVNRKRYVNRTEHIDCALMDMSDNPGNRFHVDLILSYYFQ